MISKRASLSACLLAAALAAGPLHARTWTSISGQMIEAEFVRVQNGSVVLRDSTGKERAIPLNRLSHLDRIFIQKTQTEAGTGAAPTPTPAAPGPQIIVRQPGAPVALGDPKKMGQKRAAKVTLGNISLRVVDTPRFVLLASDSYPKDLAETAEITFAAAHQILPKLSDTWSGESTGPRTAVLLLNKYDYETFGTWMQQAYIKAGKGEQAQRIATLWNQVGCYSVDALPDIQSATGASQPLVLVFNGGRNSNSSSPPDPFQTHSIASGILGTHCANKCNLPFWLRTGWAYRMEIVVADETRTHLIDYDAYKDPAEYDGAEKQGEGKVVKGAAFADGKKWPSLIQKLAKKKQLPALADVLNTELITLTPEKCGMMFGLVHWMTATPTRRNSFATVIEGARSSGQFPSHAGLAAAFGFDSLAAMETAVQEYLASKAFD